MAWDKLDRPIKEARKLARVPIVKSFQTTELPKPGECWLQSLEAEQIEWKEHLSMGPVEITKTDDGVLLVQNFDPVALRERPMIPKKVHLKLGETAQFIREHRVIGDGNVWNERQVVNVALLERFDSEVFRLRPFDYERHFRSRLVR